MPNTKSAILLFPPAIEPASSEKTEQEAVSLWDSLPSLVARPREIHGTQRQDETEAREIILIAKREAEAMRGEARLFAAAVVENANAEASQIQQDAFVDAYAKGLVQSREEVEEELTARFDERCATLRGDVDGLIEAILAERSRMWRSLEMEIVDLALDIARKVIKLEIDKNDAVIDGVVQDALRRVTDRANMRIIVNPDELEHVRAQRQDLLQAIDGVKNLEIDGDRRVGPGGCMIETSAGSIDAKIETQLEQVEQALRS